jgi:hypothetical protein
MCALFCRFLTFAPPPPPPPTPPPGCGISRALMMTYKMCMSMDMNTLTMAITMVMTIKQRTTYSYPYHSRLFPKCLLLHPGCVPCHSRSLYLSHPLIPRANFSFSTPILSPPLPPQSTIYRPLSSSTTASPSSSCAPALSLSWGRCSHLRLAVVVLSVGAEACCSWRAHAHCMLE